MIGEIRQLSNTMSQVGVNEKGEMVKLERPIPTTSKYQKADFVEFVCWIATQTQYQLDIETNVAARWNEYKLISIQFGSCEFGKKRIQWFFQWSILTDDQKATMKRILEDRTKIKIIHNAKFEYIVLRFHGIIIENVFDTMLAEKILHGGEASEDYALADISWKYLRIIMKKDEQSEFRDDIITDSKILYGITDVAYLDIIKRQQIEQASMLDRYGHDQLNTFGLEMEDLLAFSDITYNGMILNQEAWRENIRLAEPAVKETLAKLNAWLEVEPFKSYAIKQGYISPEDRITINFQAHKQRGELLKKIFPDISGGTKPIVQKYIRDNGKTLSEFHLSLLLDYIEKKYDKLEEYAVQHHRDYLISQGWIIPKGEVTINWGSWQQVLPMFQLVEPKMKSTGKDAVEKATHPFVKARQAYMEALTLLTDYGEEFIHKYVDTDGRVRTNFNLILTTGRVSSSSPNMQNIIVNKYGVGTRYRNAFTCEKDWCFCDSDYVSQELVIIAHVSKDPVWMEAINKGQDLHSICCDLVFKQRWREAAEEGCAYYEMKVNASGKLEQAKQKCSCKRHKKLRDQIKEINFGLAYGMGEFKLAGKAGISVSDAMKLIKEYFQVFPKIGEALRILGEFGLENGFINTLAPFYRKRWFPYWGMHKDSIEPHKLGVYYNPTLGDIERASKNMPIQGASADITKVAMVLIRHYIYDNGLQDKIKIVAQVHDQITTICHNSVAEEWKVKMDELMREAGKVVVPSGILRAETNLSPCWTK